MELVSLSTPWDGFLKNKTKALTENGKGLLQQNEWNTRRLPLHLLSPSVSVVSKCCGYWRRSQAGDVLLPHRAYLNWLCKCSHLALQLGYLMLGTSAMGAPDDESKLSSLSTHHTTTAFIRGLSEMICLKCIPRPLNKIPQLVFQWSFWDPKHQQRHCWAAKKWMWISSTSGAFHATCGSIFSWCLGCKIL